MFELIFNFGNIFVLPFWALITLVPNWSITRRIMGSFLPFVVIAALYVFCFASSFDPELLSTFANPTLQNTAALLADERITTAGWLHFLAFDLFVGRWIYWQGQETGIWTRHSLVLCLFAGPIGLLSHILTVWITKALGKSDKSSDQNEEAVTG
jgi:branched-subunit amino acid transport protein AzlD